jgi:hypothetical protein
MKYIKTYEDKFIDDDSSFEVNDIVKIIYNADKSLANDNNIYIVKESEKKYINQSKYNVYLIDILYELDPKSKYSMTNDLFDEFWIRNYQLELLSDRELKAIKYNL